ncbi:MAG: bifunctional acetaldehyde-CoA/alcohol dehydrogenase [Deltaproteobacteria bacterium]|jgi:acetaldehyde dehydrogenase/alcohol dehydrogenase|nr:bifunctional acetaldehyde-CoA/alcohol dehydrogenase [Deltaproteobacteria bacterium]
MVKNIEELNQIMDLAAEAQNDYSLFDQEEVDVIFKAACLAANKARIPLAKHAVAETMMGNVEDKIIKNHYAAEYTYHNYKDVKTCGVVLEDQSGGIRKIAEPMGVIAAIVPTTNPTSTAIMKALFALKTRNAMVFSPHPRAVGCTKAAVEVIDKAAVKSGAPAGLLHTISEPSLALSQALMVHPKTSLVLATGGQGLVKAAYSSGHPALGVGQGNTPAIIDATCDIPMAVNSILLSKSFDNGLICASESAVLVVDNVYPRVKSEFAANGAYFLSPEEINRVGQLLYIDNRPNPAIVGQTAVAIANMAGISVPPTTKTLIGEVSLIGQEEPFSKEKLCPVLGMYRVMDFAQACEWAQRLLTSQQSGQTALLFTKDSNAEHISYFGSKLKAVRLLINQPATFGAMGDIYNFRLHPSLSLGGGSWGGNSISDNVNVTHLLNYKTVAERKYNMLWFKVPQKIYFRPGCLPVALGDLVDSKRAFVVTDESLVALGHCRKVTAILEKMGIDHHVFSEVKPDPTLSVIRAGLVKLKAFQPDLVIALGGGSPMDAAKIMWALYEFPDLDIDDFANPFMDLRKRIYACPENVVKLSKLVCITTTSGTGSEVTPFSVIIDDATGKKFPLIDYNLTPYMAIVDPEFVLDLPPSQITFGGIDALSHAIEAYSSVMANEFSNGLALEAVRLVFDYLPESYHKGDNYQVAREKIHYASTLAGMAFANEFLGVCHSLSHKIGAKFHVPHGLANAFLLTAVMDYNRTNLPRRMTAFPQYKVPDITDRFARLANYLYLEGRTKEEKADNLIRAIERLKEEVGVPSSIKAWGRISEEEFMASLDEICEDSFDDQCTSVNPRFPSFDEIKQILLNAWEGTLSVGKVI